MTNFDTWLHPNLVKFAQDAHAKLDEQEATIEELRDDLRVALRAYRELLLKQEKMK
jgi:uncharacterized protein YoxC